MSRLTNWENQIGRRLRLRDLHVLFVVAERGSMAKAAAELGISQPSVSDVVANLEHTLGVRLFDRSPHGVEPTTYGHALLKRSLAAFDELKQGIRDIEFLSDPTAGELKIGCPEPIAAILTPIINPFFRNYPRVVVDVNQVDNRTLQLPTLRNRQCDLVIGHFWPQLLEDPLADDMNVEILFNDRLVVTAGMNSRWSRRRKVDLGDLVGEPWVLTPSGTGAHRIVSEAFRSRGLNLPSVRLVTFSAHVRAEMAASGGCVTIFPGFIARFFPSRHLVKVLPVDLPARPWPLAIVTLKNRTLSPVVERFIEHLRAFTRLMRARRPADGVKPS